MFSTFRTHNFRSFEFIFALHHTSPYFTILHHVAQGSKEETPPVPGDKQQVQQEQQEHMATAMTTVLQRSTPETPSKRAAVLFIGAARAMVWREVCENIQTRFLEAITILGL